VAARFLTPQLRQPRRLSRGQKRPGTHRRSGVYPADGMTDLGGANLAGGRPRQRSEGARFDGISASCRWFMAIPARSTSIASATRMSRSPADRTRQSMRVTHSSSNGLGRPSRARCTTSMPNPNIRTSLPLYLGASPWRECLAADLPRAHGQAIHAVEDSFTPYLSHGSWDADYRRDGLGGQG